jgi:predicted ribosomally synthesized peptide with SipW-like signal peptide
MHKKILISLSVIGAAAAIAIGATVAYFSDTETSTGNTFTTGTLDLKVNNQDDPVVIHITRINLIPYPRWSHNYGGDFTVRNTGSIPGQVWMEIKNIKNYENDCLDPEVEAGDITCEPGTTDGELGGLLYINIKRNSSPWTTYGGFNPLNNAEGVRVNGPILNPGDSIPINFDLEWDTHSGTQDNKGQGDSIEFDIVFHLDQVTP